MKVNVILPAGPGLVAVRKPGVKLHSLDIVWTDGVNAGIESLPFSHSEDLDLMDVGSRFRRIERTCIQRTRSLQPMRCNHWMELGELVEKHSRERK